MSLANWRFSCRDGRLTRKRERLELRAPVREKADDVDDHWLHCLMSFTDWDWKNYDDYLDNAGQK